MKSAGSLPIRVAIFIAIVYGADKTPFDVFKVGGRFHWNHAEMLLYSSVCLVLLWLTATAISGWLSTQFWKAHHKRMGLADIERMSEWSAADFDKDYEYLYQRFKDAPEYQKPERGLDIAGFVEVASKHGFALQRHGDSYRFGSIEKKADGSHN